MKQELSKSNKLKEIEGNKIEEKITEKKSNDDDDLLLNGDDSSDEETIEEEQEKYDLMTSWNNFFQSKQYETIKKKCEEKGEKNIENSIQYSFIAHAMGLSYLYSSEVNKEYYKIKKSKLELDNINQIKIDSVIYKSVGDVIGFLSTCFEINNDQAEKIKKNLGNDLKNPKNTRLMLQLSSMSNRQLSGNKIKLFNSLSVSVVNQFPKGLTFKEINDSKTEPSDFKAGNILKYLEINAHDDAYEVLKDVVDDFDWSIEKTLSTDEKKKDDQEVRRYLNCVIEALDAVLKNSFTLKQIKDKYRDKENGQAIIQYVKKQLEKNNRSRLIFIKEAIRKYLKASKGNSDTKTFLNSDLIWLNIAKINELLFSSIFENRPEILSNIALYFFEGAFNQEKLVFRKDLGNSYFFEQSNVPSFLANIRLSNRSQKRKVRNLSSNTSPLKITDAVFRTWGFKINQTVLETQFISTKFGRKDIVNKLGNKSGSYDEIFDNITNLKNSNKEIFDKEIAEWVRNALQGKTQNNQIELSKEEENFLYAVTYLIFGCEVARNPASIIIHQMMLDLIIAGKLPWEQALKGKLMPMSLGGAVSLARFLEDLFRPYMPHFYRYEGSSKEKTKKKTENNFYIYIDILMREAKIVEDWVKLIYQKNIQNYSLEDLQDFIIDNSQTWFGLGSFLSIYNVLSNPSILVEQPIIDEIQENQNKKSPELDLSKNGEKIEEEKNNNKNIKLKVEGEKEPESKKADEGSSLVLSQSEQGKTEIKEEKQDNQDIEQITEEFSNVTIKEKPKFFQTNVKIEETKKTGEKEEKNENDKVAKNGSEAKNNFSMFKAQGKNEEPKQNSENKEGKEFNVNDLD